MLSLYDWESGVACPSTPLARLCMDGGAEGGEDKFGYGLDDLVSPLAAALEVDSEAYCCHKILAGFGKLIDVVACLSPVDGAPFCP